MLMEQVALGSSLNELYFGILTMQNDSAELPVGLLLYVLNVYGGWSSTFNVEEEREQLLEHVCAVY